MAEIYTVIIGDLPAAVRETLALQAAALSMAHDLVLERTLRAQIDAEGLVVDHKPHPLLQALHSTVSRLRNARTHLGLSVAAQAGSTRAAARHRQEERMTVNGDFHDDTPVSAVDWVREEAALRGH